MQSSLLIIAFTLLIALMAIFGWRKAPGILLGIAATLSTAWLVSAVLTA